MGAGIDIRLTGPRAAVEGLSAALAPAAVPAAVAATRAGAGDVGAAGLAAGGVVVDLDRA
jgi:hypothetical protein